LTWLLVNLSDVTNRKIWVLQISHKVWLYFRRCYRSWKLRLNPDIASGRRNKF